MWLSFVKRFKSYQKRDVVYAIIHNNCFVYTVSKRFGVVNFLLALVEFIACIHYIKHTHIQTSAQISTRPYQIHPHTDIQYIYKYIRLHIHSQRRHRVNMLSHSCRHPPSSILLLSLNTILWHLNHIQPH